MEDLAQIVKGSHRQLRTLKERVEVLKQETHIEAEVLVGFEGMFHKLGKSS